MEYKMNQNAIDELVEIQKRFKLLSWTIESIRQNADEDIKSTLKEVHQLDLDAMSLDELNEKEEEIRSTIRFEAMSRLDWLRCDVDATCCNRSDYEPLKVEVVA